ncbi:MAG: O-antigen ligase family protein [Deinococcota bacterium]
MKKNFAMRLQMLLVQTFWALVFVVFPLWFEPLTFSLGLPAQWSMLMPKASVLGLAWSVGLLAVMLTYQEYTLVRSVLAIRRWPFVLNIFFALAVFLVINSWFLPGGVIINWFGSFRVDGLLLQAAWYSLSLLAAALIYRHPTSHPLRWAVAGVLLAGMWTLLHAFSIQPVRIFNPAALDYGGAIGSIGNVGLNAAYLSVILTAFLATQTRIRMSSLFVVALLAAAILATGNRSIPAALLLTFGSFVAYLFWKKQYTFARSLSIYGITGLLAVGIFYINQPNTTSLFNRLNATIQGRDNSFNVRRVFWQTSLRAISDQPLWGSGLNGLNYTFWREMPAQVQLPILRVKLPSEAENIILLPDAQVIYTLPGQGRRATTITVDKAHNYLLDIVIVSGWIAGSLFIVAVISGLYLLLRTYDLLARAVALSTIVYLLFGLTWFATLQVDPIVWTLFGVGIGSAWRERNTH